MNTHPNVGGVITFGLERGQACSFIHVSHLLLPIYHLTRLDSTVPARVGVQ